jgi:hypothetical protein
LGGASSVEEEPEGGDSGGVSVEGELDDRTELVLAVVVEQLEELRGEPRHGLSTLEGLLEKRLRFGNTGQEALRRNRAEGLSLTSKQRLAVCGLFDPLVTVIASDVASKDAFAVEDPYLGIGDGQGESLTESIGGDGVVVEVEADIDTAPG